jgi:hypothetical protein
MMAESQEHDLVGDDRKLTTDLSAEQAIVQRMGKLPHSQDPRTNV